RERLNRPGGCYNWSVLREGEQGGREQGRGFDDFFPKMRVFRTECANFLNIVERGVIVEVGLHQM
ncbi:MAG TPA: hypothetical protein DEA78_06540, partial [Cyanobacteria bacterium UBA11159]|nr:hypothetical protein [Cyanobacteria bacterium UBA11159]